MNYLFTSESVTEGHPDKLCDMISDSILDEALKNDCNSKVAIETMAKSRNIYVVGELTTNKWIDIPKIVRNTIKEIGYNNNDYGTNYNTCAVTPNITAQSSDIAMGVGDKEDQGAGDQGMMIGFSTNETKEMLPLPIMLAHKLVMRLTEVRKKNIIKGLRPDGKTQVTVEYDTTGRPIRVHTVVIAAQHDPNIKQKQFKKSIMSEVIEYVCKSWIDKRTIIHINGTGKFVIGGPEADSGLTGRKIIVDTYGGFASHGGGAFSGKDPSKVDRSGAYMARYVANNLVAAGVCSEITIQIAYCIGVSEPVSIYVKAKKAIITDEQIVELIRKNFSFKPKNIIKTLGLLKPIYKMTASGGHFGRKPEGDNFPWERLDKVDSIKNQLK